MVLECDLDLLEKTARRNTLVEGGGAAFATWKLNIQCPSDEAIYNAVQAPIFVENSYRPGIEKKAAENDQSNQQNAQ